MSYDPNVIDGIRSSGPPAHATEEAALKYEETVKALIRSAVDRWIVAPKCTVELPVGKRYEGMSIEKGEVPPRVLRRLIGRGVILEIDSDEVQRRRDLKRATHIYARDKVTDGLHRRKGDPAFPEHLAIKARAAYQYATKSGEVRTVAARPAQDGTERFEAAVESGHLAPNPAYEASKKGRKAS